MLLGMAQMPGDREQRSSIRQSCGGQRGGYGFPHPARWKTRKTPVETIANLRLTPSPCQGQKV